MKKTDDKRKIYEILIVAFVVRTVLMLTCSGYSTDVTCFTAWSANMVEYGANGFYTGGFFADYPPGYLYFLWGAGWLNQVLDIDPFSSIGLYIISFVPLLCDIILAWLAWYVTDSTGYQRAAILAGGLVAFSPALIFNLAVWKQVDSVITLALVLCFLLLDRHQWYASAIIYALAVLVKPQAFILGPILALGYLIPLVTANNNKERLQTLLTTVGSALCCFGLIFLGALPFQGTQELFWLPQKYFSTMSYYSYGSVNAFNFFAALGGNWQPADTGWLLTYSQWGILFVICATVLAMCFAIEGAKKGRTNLTLLAALYGIMVFTFSHGMHERYSLPFLALLLFSWIKSRDRELLWCFIAQSIASLFNVATALWCLTDTTVNGSPIWELCLRLGGVVQLAACVWLLLCSHRILCGNGAKEWIPTLQNCKTPTTKRLHDDFKPLLKWTRRDIIYICVPTLLCAIVSFVLLGSTEVPKTTWHSSEADGVELYFSTPTEITQLWIYSSIGDGYIELQDQNASDHTAITIETPFGNMYRWQVFDITPFYTQKLAIYGYDANINEIVFVSAEGTTLTPDYISENGMRLFDEQQLRPQRPSSYTGMYFDEIYHARTAYEHLTGMEPYENSHPPLGKILIMLGIKLFGMNPFGWRAIGTAFGILLLPLIYMLGRLLLGSREYALLGQILFSLDFMRYTQSRLGSIDTFAVFFIMGAYYFMLKWLHQDILITPLKKQFMMLSLSGLCFGMASSVKWVGIYAGFGLAILFFTHLWQVHEKKNRLYSLIGAGFFFFVAVPVVVYLISYLPYYFCSAKPYTLEDVWDLQQFMLGYHGKLTDTHPFESRWYSWPFIGRPMWYNLGTHLPEGMVSSIALLGNPAVWWSGIIAMIYITVRMFRRIESHEESFLVISFLSQFLPWVFISRSTFLYHYFPSLPFVILALCFTLQRLSQWKRQLCILPFLLVALATGLFVWFYPVMCDLPVTVAYANSLQWFNSWAFYMTW